jgi:hypothetical protein
MYRKHNILDYLFRPKIKKYDQTSPSEIGVSSFLCLIFIIDWVSINNQVYVFSYFLYILSKSEFFQKNRLGSADEPQLTGETPPLSVLVLNISYKYSLFWKMMNFFLFERFQVRAQSQQWIKKTNDTICFQTVFVKPNLEIIYVEKWQMWFKT